MCHMTGHRNTRLNLYAMATTLTLIHATERIGRCYLCTISRDCPGARGDTLCRCGGMGKSFVKAFYSFDRSWCEWVCLVLAERHFPTVGWTNQIRRLRALSPAMSHMSITTIDCLLSGRIRKNGGAIPLPDTPLYTQWTLNTACAAQVIKTRSGLVLSSLSKRHPAQCHHRVDLMDYIAHHMGEFIQWLVKANPWGQVTLFGAEWQLLVKDKRRWCHWNW